MFLLILWIFVLIIWIGNLILRTRPHMKLAVVNIITTAIALDNKSAESETLVETVISDEEFIQDEYYITDEGY